MLAEAFVTSRPARGLAVDESWTGRRWRIRPQGGDAARSLARDAKVSLTLADLLLARGIAAAEVEAHLNPTLRNLLPEPLLLADMYKAVERARAAIERGEQIAVFGDYDVDGSCSAALLSEFFSAIGR